MSDISIDAREDLNDLLLEMCRYGKPNIMKLAGGWFCNTDVDVVSVGVKFKAESDFKHATPMEAARECHARIVAAVKQLEAIAK